MKFDLDKEKSTQPSETTQRDVPSDTSANAKAILVDTSAMEEQSTTVDVSSITAVNPKAKVVDSTADTSKNNQSWVDQNLYQNQLRVHLPHIEIMSATFSPRIQPKNSIYLEMLGLNFAHSEVKNASTFDREMSTVIEQKLA